MLRILREVTACAALFAAGPAAAALPVFEKATAVWPKGLADEMNVSVGFEAGFDWDGASAVELKMVGWGSYRVTLNGRFVGFGPARGPLGQFRPDVWNLTRLAAKGANSLLIEVNGANVRNFYLMKHAKPFLQAEVAVNGRAVAHTGTSGAFAARRTNRRVKAPRFSYQRTFAEIYDVDGAARPTLPLVEMPAPRLIERRANYPDFELRADLKPISFGACHYDAARPISSDRCQRPDEFVQCYTVSQLPENTFGEIQRWQPSERRPSTAAERAAADWLLKSERHAVFDVGVNDTGFFGFDVEITEPTKIYVTWDELLSAAGEVDGVSRMRGCCMVTLWNITRPGRYRFDSFEPYTLRYFDILVASGAAKVSNVRFRSYLEPRAKRASFRAGDADLNRIFEAGVLTMRANAVDVFMDCPSRERAGWNCDAYFTAPVATLLTGSTALERIFEENHALSCDFRPLAGGELPMCWPSDHRVANWIPNWAMWFVLETEEYLKRSGDRATVDALRPKLEAFVTRLWAYRNADGLLERLPSWVFVEWSKANSFVQDVNYPSNMTWSQCLDAMARLYGRADLADEAERVRAAVRRQSWNGTYFRDHAVRANDGTLTVCDDMTETCQYYAFFSGVATKALYPQLWKTLLADFGPRRDATKTHPEVWRSNAFIGNYLRLKILERENRGDLILDETKEYFRKMADLTGTLWEHDSTQASCCHGFASYVTVLLAHTVLGIERINLAAKQLVLLRDVRAQTDWCEGTFPVGDEQLTVRWNRGADGKIRFDTKLPRGWTQRYGD